MGHVVRIRNTLYGGPPEHGLDVGLGSLIIDDMPRQGGWWDSAL